MVQHTVQIPMYVHVSKKTVKPLNMNCYRNLHYQSSNNQKANFKKLMADQIKALPSFKKISIHYVIYPKVRREFDVGNVSAVVDKFFSDALVELGRLPDDNYKHIPSISSEFGGFTNEEPHVIAYITDLSEARKGNPDMKLTLDSSDFEEAINAYVVSKGFPQGSVSINVDNNTIMATVNIGNKQLSEFSTPSPEETTPELPVELDSDEQSRQELLQEARDANIKGIRGNMTIETLREKLQEHNDAELEGTTNVGQNSGSSDNSDLGGSTEPTETSSEGSTEETQPTEGQTKNPFGESSEESSSTGETTETIGDKPAEEVKPKRKSSIFDED